jgi:hypothetical protein
MQKQQNRNNRGDGPRRRKARNNLGAGGPLQPPAFIPTLKLPHKFRFVCAAGGTVQVNRANLLNLVLVATSATTTARLIEGIRLVSVEAWSNPVALGSTPTTVQLEWQGINSPSTVISDTSMGVRPAHIRCIPPPNSSNQWWSMSGSSEGDVLFDMILPANTFVDVTTEMRLVEQETPTAGDVPAGAALGRIYGDYLDGITSGLCAPVGLTILP